MRQREIDDAVCTEEAPGYRSGPVWQCEDMKYRERDAYLCVYKETPGFALPPVR